MPLTSQTASDNNKMLSSSSPSPSSVVFTLKWLFFSTEMAPTWSHNGNSLKTFSLSFSPLLCLVPIHNCIITLEEKQQLYQSTNWVNSIKLNESRALRCDYTHTHWEWTVQCGAKPSRIEPTMADGQQFIETTTSVTRINSNKKKKKKMEKGRPQSIPSA